MKSELESYFPEKFSRAVAERAMAERERRKASLYLAHAMGGDEAAESEARRMDVEDAAKYKPETFSGPESAEVLTDKAFESSCFLLSQRAGMDASGMTVLGYYNALAIVSRQIETEQKALKRH